jgi:septal ring factor EnvC (AmiA/AmiB activator)
VKFIRPAKNTTVLVMPILLLIFTLFTSVTVSAQQEKQLEDIQRQIKQKQQKLETQLAEAKNLQESLKKAELTIAKTAKALNKTRNKLSLNTKQLAELIAQQKDLTEQQKRQQQLLSKQIRSAYMAGNSDYAQMLLNQDDAAKLERVLSYYQYFNKARQQQIDRFRELVHQLKRVNQDLLETQTQLKTLEAVQKKQNIELTLQQRERKKTLVKIEATIDSDAAKIEQLQFNEQTLMKAIEEAQRLTNLKPAELQGLAKLKGSLLKPTKGRLRKLFGNRRQGQVRWKGVLINGNAGNPVRAVHYGKVLYADWLRGFGLVTVLDHGQGYMSLYGHNQALLKDAGETVEAGETIALVGQSGGQASPNLYFEIRHKGKAINPSVWLKL